MQLQLIAPSADTTPLAPGQGVAHPDHVSQFDQVFFADDPALLTVDAMDPMNLDKALFDGFETASRTHDLKVAELEKAIEQVSKEGEHLTISSLLKVQVELANVSFHEQLTVKVADKTSEGIKTLFRNQ